MGKLVFVTGGARSGKSRYAQKLAESCPGPLLYVATAGIGDSEMADRVRRHRQERGERWRTLEEPLALAEKLPPAATGQGAMLLDCATLWLSNLLFQHREDVGRVLAEVENLLAVVPVLDAPLFLVSNEVGGGIVPENRLARLFRDVSGEANQKFAAAADEAWLVVAGLPLRLK
ncbi:MAG: bifunctional adenosylcobinamide kinase/adenosylcobinamide-phosphate guanylyltransferase [Desulfuromonadales bacterium]